MKNLFSLLLLLSTYYYSFAQVNLVVNGNFENSIPPTASGQLTRAAGWLDDCKTPTSTPDLIDVTNATFNSYGSIPDLIAGNRYYAHFVQETYSTGAFAGERIKASLTQSLAEGCYELCFWVAPPKQLLLDYEKPQNILEVLLTSNNGCSGPIIGKTSPIFYTDVNNRQWKKYCFSFNISKEDNQKYNRVLFRFQNAIIPSGNSSVNQGTFLDEVSLISKSPSFELTSDKLSLCNDGSESATLTAAPLLTPGSTTGLPVYNYRWVKGSNENGTVLLSGSNKNVLTVYDPGCYTVVVSSKNCSISKTICIEKKICSCEFTRPSITTTNLFGNDGSFDNYQGYLNPFGDCSDSPNYISDNLDNLDILTNIGWCYEYYSSSPSSYSGLFSSFPYFPSGTFNEHTSNGDGSSGAYYGQFQPFNNSGLDPCVTNPPDWDTPAYFAKKINANTNNCFNVCLWAFAFNNDCNLACGNPCPKTSFALYVKSPSGTETIISIKNDVDDAWELISGEFCATESGEYLVGVMVSRENINSYNVNEISVSSVFFALDDIEIYRARRAPFGGISEGELVISPNPNNGIFALSINDENITSNTSVSINITNNLGYVVYSSQVLGAGSFNINLNGQKPGVYNVSVTHGSVSLNERVVITGQ
jgi:hypothetical protein